MNKNLKNQLKGLYIDIRIQCKNLMDDINEEKLIDIIHALYLISCEIKDIYNELEDVSPKLTTSIVGLFLCPFARFS